jgi:hypothetical protein
LLCYVPHPAAKVAGAGLVSVAGIVETVEWRKNSKEDAAHLQQVRTDFTRCCRNCGEKYHDWDAARNHFRKMYPQ